MLFDVLPALRKIGTGLDGLTQLLGILAVLALGAIFLAAFVFLVIAPLVWPDVRKNAFAELRKRPLSAMFNGVVTVGMCGFLAYVFLRGLM